ncbi:peroxisomal membrane protein 11C-like isoform X1 [Haliotis rufescens]|uniref:peroxisomal membrane protein 11C-like isoform X1 n=1 Tax=Haliotis rufescens TaxID=6454 RepID=UPI00201EB1C7|nr:peroxisomal membrane protein 11C-like isoform X1 [Haliotis rufescens]
MSLLVDCVKFIETYRGRDKIIRLCSYAAMLVGGDNTSPISEKARVIGRELSACRVILRLFDDLPMLAYNLQYGLGSKEKNPCLRVCELGSNLVNQLYYPIEHIAWCADKQLLTIKSGSFWLAGLILWAISLTLQAVKCLLTIARLKRSANRLKKQRYLDGQDQYYENSEQREELWLQLHGVQADIFSQYLLLLQSMADLLNAINWLPKGWLWGGRFGAAKSGLFGLASSLIMLFRHWYSRS